MGRGGGRNPSVCARSNLFFLTLPQVRTKFGNWFVMLRVSLKTGLGHLSSGLFILFVTTSREHINMFSLQSSSYSVVTAGIC